MDKCKDGQIARRMCARRQGPRQGSITEAGIEQDWEGSREELPACGKEDVPTGTSIYIS